MKTLIIYDSFYGNTQTIASAIASNITNAKLLNIKNVNNNHLDNLDLLIIGSPTHGGQATATINDFIKQIPAGILLKTKISAFDTGIHIEGQNIFLKFVIKILGYAAKKIANKLHEKGGIITIKPEGFFVVGKEGPLVKGELLRAKKWAKQFNDQQVKESQ